MVGDARDVRLSWILAVASLALAVGSAVGLIPIWEQIQQGNAYADGIQRRLDTEDFPDLPDPTVLGFIPFGIFVAGLGALISGGAVIARGEERQPERASSGALGIATAAMIVSVLALLLLFGSALAYSAFGVPVWW